jgi:3-hydroxyacyl-[acyl-carrier-protein] dehydratase
MNSKLEVAQGHFIFDSQDPIYNDHFPGSPVVPGSLIVQAFVLAAGKFTADVECLKVEQFRFKRFIGPGRYAFRLDRTDRRFLRCLLLDGDIAVATGRLAI